MERPQARWQRLIWALTGLTSLAASACMNRGETRPDPPKPVQATPVSQRAPMPRFPEPRPPQLVVPAQYPQGMQPVELPQPQPTPRIQVRQIEPTVPTPTAPEPRDENALIRALRAHLEKRPELARVSLSNLDEANREALNRLLAVAARISETNLDDTDPEKLAALIDELHQVGDQLRPHAALRTGTVCFCRGVTRFGEYLPYDKNPSFRPGEGAEVYVELHNFHNEPVQDPTGESRQGGGERMFRNRFRGELAVRDADGRLVWQDDWHFSAYSRTPRRDSHLVIGFEAPRELPSGRYSLMVTLVDEPTSRKTQRSLGFWVSNLGGRSGDKVTR